MTDEKDPLSTGGAFNVLGDIDRDPDDALIGRRLGDYAVVAPIASGGMGRVYRGRRADGEFAREVAIKVSASGAISTELLARFRQEQSVLASLNHPHICQLFDAGVTEEGWPYFVMELVDGESIVDHCENNALSQRQRLDLLIDVADAVAFAHRHLVVHRDIKPANVMVSKSGGVKLLDFGIAKLLESDDALTRAPVLTPRYASPEQLLGQTVTISSDIAQIGLLIYETFTGAPLADTDSLEDAIRRAVDKRSFTLDGELARRVPPELRPVVDLCLRAEPAERYADVNSLRADLEAFRDGYPLRAVGRSAAYRARKFMGRNAPMVIMATVAVVGLFTTATWYTIQLRDARTEAQAQAEAARLQAEKSDQIADFMVNMFIDANPRSAKGEDVMLSDVIETGVERIRNDLDDKPALKASLLFAISGMQNDLGFFDEASQLIDESIAVYEAEDLGDPVAYGLSLYRRGILDWETGNLEAALDPLRRALALFRQSDTDDSVYWETWITNTLGMVASQLNDFELALDYHNQSLAVRKSYYGEEHVQVALSLANFAAVYTKQGKHKQALPYYEEAYQKAVEQLEENDPQIARMGMNLGRAYLQAKRFDEAGTILRRSADTDRLVFGENNVNYSYSLMQLGILAHEQENYAEALKILQQVVAIQRESLGDDNWRVASTVYRLGTVHLDLQQYTEAESLLAEADGIIRRAFPTGHRYSAYIVAAQARLLEETGRHASAISRYQSALEFFAQTVGDSHPDSARSRVALARLLLNRDGVDAAWPVFNQALSILETSETEIPNLAERVEPLLAALRDAGRLPEVGAVERRLQFIAQQTSQ